MSKKEKLDLKNKIDAIMFAMLLISDKIDKQQNYMTKLQDENDMTLSRLYIEKCQEHLDALEDIRAEYQKRLSQ